MQKSAESAGVSSTRNTGIKKLSKNVKKLSMSKNHFIPKIN
jgi:hypothetical protein